jgi:putative tryptophan/tyrosine transport system substrate-binding protein
MKRRDFISLLGGAVAVWPLIVRAQDAGRTYRIGFLLPSTRESLAVVALFDELRLNGFVEGQNLIVIPGGFGIPNDQIANVVASLVAASPDVIVSGPELPLRALQKATQTIPAIGMTEDMVADGLVASFAQPGGNITGISLLSPELDGKRQEILIEATPGVRKIAVLADSNVAKPMHLQQLQQAAQSHGVEALVRGVAKREDVISAINDVKALGAQAINFLATPMFSVNAADFIRQVTTLRLPSIYQWPENAEETRGGNGSSALRKRNGCLPFISFEYTVAGGLLSYGISITDAYRQYGVTPRVFSRAQSPLTFRSCSPPSSS